MNDLPHSLTPSTIQTGQQQEQLSDAVQDITSEVNNIIQLLNKHILHLFEIRDSYALFASF